MNLFRTAAPLALCALLGTVFAPAASAANLEISNTTFGWNKFTQSVPSGGSGPLAGFPAAAVNQFIDIKFNQKLKKNSVTEAAVRVTSVPADVLVAAGIDPPGPGGQIAPVTFEIKGNRLRIRPAVVFTGTTVSFGYVPNSFYQVEIKSGAAGPKGGGGAKIKGQSRFVFFRTTGLVIDPKSGAPTAKVRIVDSTAGVKNLKPTDPPKLDFAFSEATTSPPPQIEFDFDEPVLPSSVVNPANGLSPSLKVQIDADGNFATPDRVDVPGRFTLTQTAKDAFIVWDSVFETLPGEANYVVTIEPTVSDLVGNSVFSITGDIGKRTLFAFRTGPGGSIALTPVVETFANKSKLDTANTSADWATTEPGLLKPGAGGGTGNDGPFQSVDDTVLETSVFDVDLGMNVPRIWDFQGVTIPLGVTVTATGEFPLHIRSAGQVTIDGTLDVSGLPGDAFVDTAIHPGNGGAGALGGGAGGLGGSVTDGVDLVTPLFAANVPGYMAGVQPNQGLTGLSAMLSGDTLTKSGGDAFTSALVGKWLQPNVGTSSPIAGATPGNEIFHIHPTFQITQVVGPDTLKVDAVTFGPMNQPGLDLYELPAPPIAKPGDPFIAGDLAGHEAASIAFAGGGGGSLPLTVAQAFVTQVRSGGGGGGGARSPGDDGEDAPPSGVSQGTDGGAGGGGYLSGTIASITATTLTATGTPFTGLDLDGGADPDVDPPFLVFPDVAQGYVFEIDSHTANALTIAPRDLLSASPVDVNGDLVLDLTDLGAIAGATFRVEPSFRTGGSGGGGSGVHLGGTSKLTAPPPDGPGLTLPTWRAGAGGGAGGGSLIVETSARIIVNETGIVRARGGDGGRTSGGVGTGASGGGGGAGGTIVFRSGDPTPFAIKINGLADARGGEGGIGLVQGGAGGDGRVRLESSGANLDPASFSNGVTSTVFPELTDTDIGLLVAGETPSAARSLFYFVPALGVHYVAFTVTYNVEIDGVAMTGLTFTSQDLANGVEVPFMIEFNDANVAANGNLDVSSVDDVFTSDLSTLSGSYVRFRMSLDPLEEISGQEFKRVEIDRVEIEVTS